MRRRRAMARSKDSAALGFVKPYKPISQMSDDELRKFARELGNLIVAKMKVAKEAVEAAEKKG